MLPFLLLGVAAIWAHYPFRLGELCDCIEVLYPGLVRSAGREELARHGESTPDVRFAGVGGLDNSRHIDEVRRFGPDSQVGGGSKSTDLHSGSPAIAEDRHAAQFNPVTPGSDKTGRGLLQSK